MVLEDNIPTLFKSFLNFWQNLPRDNKFKSPHKNALKMKNMVGFLPYYFLSEYIDEKTLLNRIIGTGIDDKLGSKLTGQNIFDIYQGERRTFITQYWAALIQTPCGGFLSREITVNRNHFFVDGIQLPLLNDQGKVAYCCGVATVTASHKNLTKEIPKNLLIHGKIKALEYIDIGMGLPKNPPNPKLYKD